MSQPYSPSRLRIVEEHCPKALDYYEEKGPDTRDHFGTGTAFHYIMQRLGQTGLTLDQLVPTIVPDLIASGPPGKDGPIAPAQVIEAVELVRPFIEKFPLPAKGLYEIPAVYDRDWKGLTGFTHKDARFRMVLDQVFKDEAFEDDDGAVGVAYVARDFKTAWNAGPEWFDTVQGRAQALAMSLRFPNDVVAIEVTGVRTLQTWRRVFQPGEAAGFAPLLTAVMDGLDRPRQPRPGPGCCGCPFTGRCEAFKAVFEATGTPATAEGRIVKWLAAKAVLEDKGFVKMVRLDCNEGPVNGVGHYTRQTKSVDGERLAKGWTGGLMDFLAHYGSLTVTGAKKVAKVMEVELDDFVVTKTSKRFGIIPTGEGEEDGAE